MGDSCSPIDHGRFQFSQRYVQIYEGFPQFFPKAASEISRKKEKMSNKIVKEAHTASVVNLNELMVSLGRE